MIAIWPLLRPHQWIKNVIIFAPLIFAQKLGDPESVKLSMAAFVIFCLVASGMYVFNDYLDRDRDKKHPSKKNRPLAIGTVTPSTALVTMIVLLSAGIMGSIWLSSEFFLASTLYILLVASYCLWLKHIAIIDILILSTGFVLRAIAGAVAINVAFSPWLIVTTFFLALLLSLGKRRHEAILLGDQARYHRKSLNGYSLVLMDKLITQAAAASLICFTLYTLWPETVERYGTTNLIYTLPLVVYGLFRYLQLIYQENDGGDPSQTLYTDRALLISVTLWGTITAGVIHYL